MKIEIISGEHSKLSRKYVSPPSFHTTKVLIDGKDISNSINFVEFSVYQDQIAHWCIGIKKERMGIFKKISLRFKLFITRRKYK